MQGNANRSTSLRGIHCLILLLVAFGLTGCAAKSAPPASARARERAAPNSAVKRGKVSRVRINGLKISFVLGGGRVVILPDGRYRHRDGYILYVSGGRIVEVGGLTPVYKVKIKNKKKKKKGKGRGNRKNKVKVKIKKVKVKGTRIIFFDDDDGEMTLPGGVYSSGGYQVVVSGGDITSVVLDDD